MSCGGYLLPYSTRSPNASTDAESLLKTGSLKSPDSEVGEGGQAAVACAVGLVAVGLCTSGGACSTGECSSGSLEKNELMLEVGDWLRLLAGLGLSSDNAGLRAAGLMAAGRGCFAAIRAAATALLCWRASSSLWTKWHRGPYGQKPTVWYVRHNSVLYLGCLARLRNSAKPWANWHLSPYLHTPNSSYGRHNSVL